MMHMQMMVNQNSKNDLHTLLSTHADRQGVDISFTVCFSVLCACLYGYGFLRRHRRDASYTLSVHFMRPNNDKSSKNFDERLYHEFFTGKTRQCNQSGTLNLADFSALFSRHGTSPVASVINLVQPMRLTSSSHSASAFVCDRTGGMHSLLPSVGR